MRDIASAGDRLFNNKKIEFNTYEEIGGSMEALFYEKPVLIIDKTWMTGEF
jgi:hypothetical protein